MPGAAEIVVVGAGFAGLAAAQQLTAAGQRVRLLERDARAGGRAALATPPSGAVDPTAARVTTADAALLDTIRAARLDEHSLPLRPWTSAQLAVSGSGFGPVGDDEPGAIARTAGVRWLDALRLRRLPRLARRYAPHLDLGRAEQAAPLDDRSLHDFGELYFGRSVVSRWLEPWLAERAPVDERQASRVAFLLRWWAERNAAPGALREAPGLLAELLAARLGVQLRASVTAIEARSGGRLRLAIETPARAETLEADAVLLALPAADTLRLVHAVVGTAEREALGAMAVEAAISWTGRARPLPVSVPTRVRIPRAAGSPLASVSFEPTAGGGPADVGSGRVTAIAGPAWSAAHLSLPDAALAEALTQAVARCVPGGFEFAGEGHVARFPAAWPRFEVGAFRRLARFRAVQDDRRAGGRRLYFAGDWLAAASLEGAAVSGRRAALDLLADLRI
ncbi:FAD-dependent oxidoreductase [Myxococcota bacterium]|nr:FAD-dependent oxidoreductase [Myxococcota bacterium]